MTTLKTLVIALIILPILSSCSDDSSSSESNRNSCPDTNCSDYQTQNEAQIAFDADRECRGDLDSDNDGIACEHLPSTSKDCPTTSNCGCSNKNKSSCESDSCCKWVVGDGCQCA